MPGDSGRTTTTTNQEPWGAQQPYLKRGFQRADELYGDPIEQYAGSRVGALSAMTQEGQQAGLGLIRGAGMGGAEEYLQRLMGGEYLSPESNPHLRQLADLGAEDITRQYKTALYPGASMARFGRAGSGAEANLQYGATRGLGDALSRNYANIYGANYNRERGFMQQGVGLSAQLGANRRADITTGTELGYGRDAYEQRLINDLVGKFNFQQQEPGQRLDDYTRRIYGGGVIPGISESTGTMSGQNMGAAQWAGLGISALGLFTSTRTAKEHVDWVDTEEALEMIRALPIALWRYLPERVDADPRLDRDLHMGAYAEDFKGIFKIGNGQTLTVVDLCGVALAAVKGAAERLAKLETRLAQYEGMLKFEPVEVANA